MPQVEACNRRDVAAGRRPYFRRCCFLFEPFLVLHCFGEFPVKILRQEYIVNWYKERLTVSGMLLQNHTYTLANASSRCPDDNGTALYLNHKKVWDHVQSAASWFAMYESLVWGIPAIASTLYFGSVGDRFGRLFSIIPPLIGDVVFSVTAFLVIWSRASITWLFFGDIVYGCCGSSIAMVATGFAFIADQTAPERRLVRIVVAEVSMLAAGLASSAGLGFIVRHLGSTITVLIFAATSTMNLVFVFLFLKVFGWQHQQPIREDQEEQPSTAALTHSTSSGVNSSSASPFNGHHNSFVSLFSTAGSRRWKLAFLVVALLIMNMPEFDESVRRLFMMNRPLCWSVSEIGVFSGVSLALRAVGGALSGLALKCCLSDCAVAVVAGLAATGHSVYMFFVRYSAMMYVGTSMSVFVFLLVPSIRSTMSSMASQHEQGAVFGVIASVEVVCIILGTITFNAIYSSTLHIESGFVFLTMAVFYAVGCILITVVWLGLRKEIHRNDSLSGSVSCVEPTNHTRDNPSLTEPAAEDNR